MFNLTQGTYNGDASGDRTYAYLGKSTPSEDTHTFEHIGVGVEAGDLSLMCADGTTRNTGGSLGGNIGNVGDTFYLVWDPSVPEVDLYRNALAANKVNPFQTLSSNVPSTSTYPDSVGVVADNDGDGHEVGMEIVEFEMGVGE